MMATCVCVRDDKRLVPSPVGGRWIISMDEQCLCIHRSYFLALPSAGILCMQFTQRPRIRHYDIKFHVIAYAYCVPLRGCFSLQLALIPSIANTA